MKLRESKALRQAFLDYFKGKNHVIVPSSPLVPSDDPTLLFTNAGMVQFKDCFLGKERRGYKRAASCQKCVRAGGKHNDLENVGYTARHHTFFEMLGNFSFGDYFKEEAISYAWDFLANVVGLPTERLYVTVYRDDDEAMALWPKVAGIDPERVIGLGEKDNFWSMGDTGPCGPCSEILIDQGPDVGCKRPDCRVGCDCDRFLELWNLVFMQYFRDESGVLHPLPRPSIDTGMGLERIAAVCQGKLNNFDTDLFSRILLAIQHVSGAEYGIDPRQDVAMRVIADHARATAFLIADGVVPSNEGRGFVLRRIMRRAARYGRGLGLDKPFMAGICDAVIESMEDVYPELRTAREFMRHILDAEEERFLKTLDLGLEMLKDEIRRLNSIGVRVISGSFAFKLYDTYGIPIDIVQDIAREEGFELEREEFEKEMDLQRKRSKASGHGGAVSELPSIYQELVEKGLGSTFVGYETLDDRATLLALFDGDSCVHEARGPGWSGEAVFSRTPFYGESGGQAGDRGEIRANGVRARVVDTRKNGTLICHEIEIQKGSLEVGKDYELHVFKEQRADTARNHTATHLLHAALRKVLGEHVKQSGSLVTPERLRFDFTHFSHVDHEELQQIEAIVNQEIMRNVQVRIFEMDYEEAMRLGAMALFGEKYGARVRVVEVPGFSRELCGGTHVERTGDIGFFKIVGETSVAAGIRRIEAVTGREAVDYVHHMEDTIISVASALKCPQWKITDRVTQLLSKVKALTRELEELKLKGGTIDIGKIVEEAPDISGVKLVCHQVDGADAKILRELGDRLRSRLGSGVVVLGSKNKKKALILVMVTKDLTERVHAGDLVKVLSRFVGGGGGGRPDMAQAGGPDTKGLEKALSQAPELVAKALDSCSGPTT